MTLSGLAQAPRPLLVVGALALGIAITLVLVMVWHVIRRVFDRPRVPLWGGTYVMMFVAVVVLGGAGVLAVLIADALVDWPAAAGDAVAEMRCRPTGRAGELTIVPLPTRTPVVTAPVTGSCVVRATLLRFAAPLEGVGVGARYRLQPTSVAASSDRTPAWRALPQPAGLPVATTRTETLIMNLEPAAVWRVTAGETALHLERAR